MGKMLKPTLLSVSLITVMSGAAVAPALGNITTAFPGTNPTLIKLILTLPAMFIIPFTFISGKLSAVMPKRTVLLIGIALYIAGGLGGGFVNSIGMLLVFRALLGMGVGLIMPLSTSLVADFYEGDARTKMMGQVGASNNLGGIIALVLSGWLASISWRFSFGVYLLGLFVALLVLLFLPAPPRAGQEVKKMKEKLPEKLYGLAAAMFLLMVAFYSIPTNMSLFIEGNGFGGAETSGIVMSLNSVGGIIAGLTLSRVKNILQKYMITVLLGVVALGYVLISTAQVLLPVVVGVGLIGFGFGSLMPLILVQVTQSVEREQTVTAMAVVSSMIYLGQFLSPVILDAAGVILGNETISFTYRFTGAVIAALSIGWLAKTILARKPVRSES
ncbi:Predicted arabinose efflux permease, MFS family [Desulfotomaculum arcticum]|uniref:Predicted arabinose efflux permease, MFS family n=1 Tax=Desulfotruncus arcticus DSM 17038 TaxID=1121424 RepID=A0A1I2YSH9_9FIRM|nr:MFS transporter [Desulfotruncus arcticus]SFH27591.1 Predicted arabinose efflux permease, MFS family [Desulfotomaculum arcticum] [Desulfotruncus arcticus DSM 17038]